nr:hypothetical protein [Tanacetum cinerariifolium]
MSHFGNFRKYKWPDDFRDNNASVNARFKTYPIAKRHNAMKLWCAPRELAKDFVVAGTTSESLYGAYAIKMTYEYAETGLDFAVVSSINLIPNAFQVYTLLHRIYKSIQRSDEQQNLYKALVEAYDADKAILDTYGGSTILKRRRDDDDQEGPFVGSNRGSKRQKERGEHASAINPSEIATEGAGRSTTGSQSRQLSASESAFAEEPVQTTCQMEESLHPVFETGADD